MPLKQLMTSGLVLLVFFSNGCSGGSSAETTQSAAAAANENETLSEEQMEIGIGPIRQVTLGPLDEAMAARGKATFDLKCAACHKMDQRYVGPLLGDVLDRHRPEYVMNMILNPAEMILQHPTAKALLAQFMTPMPDQNLTEAEARDVLEYLRKVAVKKP